MSDKKKMDRRDFLKKGCKASCAALIGTTVFGVKIKDEDHLQKVMKEKAVEYHLLSLQAINGNKEAQKKLEVLRAEAGPSCLNQPLEICPRPYPQFYACWFWMVCTTQKCG